MMRMHLRTHLRTAHHAHAHHAHAHPAPSKHAKSRHRRCWSRAPLRRRSTDFVFWPRAQVPVPRDSALARTPQFITAFIKTLNFNKKHHAQTFRLSSRCLASASVCARAATPRSMLTLAASTTALHRVQAFVNPMQRLRLRVPCLLTSPFSRVVECLHHGASSCTK